MRPRGRGVLNAPLSRSTTASETIYNGAALSPRALDSFAALAQANPEDRTTALHLERLARGERGIEMVLTEK